MKRVLTVLCAILAVTSLRAQKSPVDVTETVLSNGMTVWINEDHSQPKIFGAVVVKAGAKDCPDTGLAHYLEHLLFKGTEEMGTVDYQAEKVWLDSIALCYNSLSQTTDEAVRTDILKEINRLSIKAAEYAIPNEFDLLTARFGGTGLNAATSYDYTYYYNTFPSLYLPQWAELNSHRLLKPVFRLFQGELETVYEEKNRSADETMHAPLMEMVKEFSGDNPYSYEIIGSTQNLKNPRLGEMMDFFHKYYVGCNMGLILSGDIKPEGLQPLLEATFGRIPRGEVPSKPVVEQPVFEGSRSVKIKAQIPLVKAAVYGFNGPVDSDPDAPVLDLATSLLSNSFSSGLLDSLSNSHKVLMAMSGRVPMFNEMGVVGYAVIPKLPFGSLKKAEKRCREQIEKVKNGEFSDSDLEALKLEAARNSLGGLETIDGRSDAMVDIMSQNRSWDSYLAEVDRIGSITRDDIVSVANKYFTPNYIRFQKVTGSYPKDKVSKPDFDPIVPPHAGEKSAYAKKLEEMPSEDLSPRFLDLNNDVSISELCPGVTLYYKENPVNSLFTFEMVVDKGEYEDPLIPHIASFVGNIGTDSLTVQQLAKAWQQLGTTFYTDSGRHSFTLSMGGFDSAFAPSLGLLQHVTTRVKADKKAFNEIKTGITLDKKTFLSGGTSNIMQALQQRVWYGEASPLLNKLTANDLAKTGMEGLLEGFRRLMSTECSIFYCGSIPRDEVESIIKEKLDLSGKTERCERKILPFQTYSEPTVFMYDLDGSRQTQIASYQVFPAPENGVDKAAATLLSDYIGGGMYSLMFQEVREFRAMAYSAWGGIRLPAPIEKQGKAMLYTSLGTQSDKALSALSLVDSLLTVMPLKESGLAASDRYLRSEANNGYPSFRDIASSVHSHKVLGYTDDPNREIIGKLPEVSTGVLERFYKGVSEASPRSWIIVGDASTLPLAELEKYGRIVVFKEKDIYR